MRSTLTPPLKDSYNGASADPPTRLFTITTSPRPVLHGGVTDRTNPKEGRLHGHN